MYVCKSDFEQKSIEAEGRAVQREKLAHFFCECACLASRSAKGDERPLLRRDCCYCCLVVAVLSERERAAHDRYMLLQQRLKRHQASQGKRQGCRRSASDTMTGKGQRSVIPTNRGPLNDEQRHVAQGAWERKTEERGESARAGASEKRLISFVSDEDG